MGPQDAGQEARLRARPLGSLESQLMTALWGVGGELSVQQVCDALGGQRNYKTVMTVLNRLVEKDLLERRLEGRAYRYQARTTKDEFLRDVAQDTVMGFIRAYGPEAADHLAEAVTGAAPQRRAPQPPVGSYTEAQPGTTPWRPPPILRLLVVGAVLQLILYLRSQLPSNKRR